jgi:hypothetical protein
MNLWPWEWTKTETNVHKQYVRDLEARQSGRDIQHIKEKEEIEQVSL